MVSQAMEWDADKTAIDNVLSPLWLHRQAALKDFQAARPLLADDTLLLLITVIACSGFFRGLDADKPVFSDWRLLDHHRRETAYVPYDRCLGIL